MTAPDFDYVFAGARESFNRAPALTTWQREVGSAEGALSGTHARLIGLAGYARVGKDTVGDLLHDHYGYERRAFADKLRELAWRVRPDIGQVVADIGYERAKHALPELRPFLVAVGAGAREILGRDVWLDATLRPPDAQGFHVEWGGPCAQHEQPTVVTDVRYVNEARRIVDLGGVVVYIARTRVGPANDEEDRTIAELRRLVPHRYLLNVGGLDDLRHAVNDLMSGLHA